jgi:hypothetical protein
MRLIKVILGFAVLLGVLAQTFDGAPEPREDALPSPPSTFQNPVINEDGWAVSWPGREHCLPTLNQYRLSQGWIRPGSTDPNARR